MPWCDRGGRAVRGIAAARAAGRAEEAQDIFSRGGLSSYQCGPWGTVRLLAVIVSGMSATARRVHVGHVGHVDLFTARFARVLVAIAGVLELGAALEEL